MLLSVRCTTPAKAIIVGCLEDLMEEEGPQMGLEKWVKFRKVERGVAVGAKWGHHVAVSLLIVQLSL